MGSEVLARRDVLNGGFIELIGMSGGDLDIINNAKVSFDRYMTQEEFDADPEGAQGFIDFLVRERHGTPTERPVVTARVKAPIFIFREWHRHRLASINEESMRYSVRDTPDHFLPAPEDVREQKGKPGAYYYEQITDPFIVNEGIEMLDLAQRFAFRTYRQLLDMGWAKELARTCLPVGTYSTMIWQANLRATLNFLSLRGTDERLENGGHAQREIKVYADALAEMLEEHVPMTMSAFNRHGRIAP